MCSALQICSVLQAHVEDWARQITFVPLEIMFDLPFGFPINNVISHVFQQASPECCSNCSWHTHISDLTCKCGSFGQSEGMLKPRSSVQFRLNPETSNSDGFALHRPSSTRNEIDGLSQWAGVCMRRKIHAPVGGLSKYNSGLNAWLSRAYMSVSLGVGHLLFAAPFCCKVENFTGSRSATVDFLARMQNWLYSFDIFHSFGMFCSSFLVGTSRCRGFYFGALYTLSSKEILPPSFAIVFSTVYPASCLVQQCQVLAWHVCPHLKRVWPTNDFPLFAVLLDATFECRLVRSASERSRESRRRLTLLAVHICVLARLQYKDSPREVNLHKPTPPLITYISMSLSQGYGIVPKRCNFGIKGLQMLCILDCTRIPAMCPRMAHIVRFRIQIFMLFSRTSKSLLIQVICEFIKLLNRPRT